MKRLKRAMAIIIGLVFIYLWCSSLEFEERTYPPFEYFEKLNPAEEV